VAKLNHKGKFFLKIPSRRIRSALLLTSAILTPFSYSGCAKPEDSHVIDSVRTVPSALRQVPANMSSPERFGFSSPTSEPRNSESLALAWKVPEGWETLPTGGMRAAAFRIGQRGECSLTILAGSAGGVEANVNRWRAQMGLSPMTAEEIQSLPTVNILGVQAPFVELRGTFSGMAGQTEPNWVLLGAICLLPDSAVFVKATGPEEDLLPQREAFLAFCDSLRKAGHV